VSLPSLFRRNYKISSCEFIYLQTDLEKQSTYTQKEIFKLLPGLSLPYLEQRLIRKKLFRWSLEMLFSSGDLIYALQVGQIGITTFLHIGNLF
jgi:hypothetical protein